MPIARVPGHLLEALAFASGAFLVVMVALLWGYMAAMFPATPEAIIQAAALFGGLAALGIWSEHRMRVQREHQDWLVQTDLRLASAALVRAVRDSDAATYPKIVRALRDYDAARALESEWRRGKCVPSEHVEPKGEIED